MNKLILTLALCLSCAAAQAQTLTDPSAPEKPAVTYRAQTPSVAPKDSSKEPLDISADESLEWKRNDKIFIARKNAIAIQGDTSIAAQTLTADYRDEKGSMKIWRMTAEDTVIITSKDSKAYGAKAIYDVDKGNAVMTGDNLKLESPDQTVTAKDRFEYDVNAGKLTAIGAAKAVRKNPKGGSDTLMADQIAATMKDNAKGQRVLEKLEANGHVIIKTATETVTGSKGVYNASTNKAVLTGGVTITRGQNVLQGSKAEVDLNTNTSRMFGSGGGEKGRVRGVFYPGSEKKP